jgi:hypothetical protein
MLSIVTTPLKRTTLASPSVGRKVSSTFLGTPKIVFVTIPTGTGFFFIFPRNPGKNFFEETLYFLTSTAAFVCFFFILGWPVRRMLQTLSELALAPVEVLTCARTPIFLATNADNRLLRRVTLRWRRGILLGDHSGHIGLIGRSDGTSTRLRTAQTPL